MKIQPNIAYHCKTIEAAREWIRLANEQGLNELYPLTENGWLLKKEDACLFFNSVINSCVYGSLDFYKKTGIEVVEFPAPEEFAWGEESGRINKKLLDMNFDNVNELIDYIDSSEFSNSECYYLRGFLKLEIGTSLGRVLWEKWSANKKKITPSEAQQMLKDLGVDVEVVI